MGIGFLIGGQSLFASEAKKREKEALRQQVKELVESNAFTIDVDRALPMGGRSINLTGSYTLELRHDSALVYLPYYGRAYIAPIGGGGGIEANDLMEDFVLDNDKKGNIEMEFKVSGEGDRYRFIVTIYTNGKATIRVTPQNKQGISFHGELRL